MLKEVYLHQRSSLLIFFAVQKALFLREFSMRFSVSKSGLFWTFFEPFFQVFVMVLIKVLLFGTAGGNFDFAAFLALNFTAYNLKIFLQNLWVHLKPTKHSLSTNK